MDLGMIGGFDFLGKRYGKLPYKIINAVDNDPYCTKIYNENFSTKCEIQDVKTLDEKTLEDVRKALGKPIRVVQNNGESFIRALWGLEEENG